jgi:hypothetical protein
MAEQSPKQVILHVDPVNGKVINVTGYGNITRKEPSEIDPAELTAGGPFRHAGTLYHRHTNPDCFYFEYIGSIWEICF